MRTLPVAVLVLALSWACGSSPSAPIPPDSILPPAPAVPAPAEYHVSGVVTDEGGAPIANMAVEVVYSDGTANRRTTSGGSYEVDIVPAFQDFRGIPGTLGVVFVSGGGYWPNLQSLPSGKADVVRNVRLRPVHTLSAGQSILLSMDPDSSLVGEIVNEDYGGSYWDLKNALERFLVDTPVAGRLFIGADEADDHSGYPYLSACRPTGRGCAWMMNGQRVISFDVQAGAQYEISVTAPRRDPSRRYTVNTLLQP